MSLEGNDPFSSPQSTGRTPEAKAETTPASAHTTPSTPLSHGQYRQNLVTGAIPDTPNDHRSRLRTKDHDASTPTSSNIKNWRNMDSQVKFYRQKLNEQEEAHKAKIRSFELEIGRLKTRIIDPEYIEGLEANNEALTTASETLLKQFETLKAENKKLNYSNAWQRQEIDHIRQECLSNGAAIQSVAVDQQSEFDAKVRQLDGQLKAAHEENTELYDKCAELQQENDNLKAGSTLDSSTGPNSFNLARDKQLKAKQVVIEESKKTINRQEDIILELMETIRRQEDQIEDWTREKAFGSTANLGSELDIDASSPSTITSERGLGLSLEGELGDVEHEKEHTAAVTAGRATLEQPPSKALSRLDKLTPTKPKNEARFFSNPFAKLYDRPRFSLNNVPTKAKLTDILDRRNEDMNWSLEASHRLVREDLSSNRLQIEGNFLHDPPFSLRVWTEMISLGRTYWVSVATRNRTEWVKVSGPRWWSLIIQLLGLILVWSLSVAYWCIMKASAERELWLDANEVTMKKYWDTAVWGVERGVLWRLHYGLGLV